MVDARFRLVWPKDLFKWEARKVLALDDAAVYPATVHLLEEAFSDPSVVAAYSAQFSSRSVWDDDYMLNNRGWLADLVVDDARLIPYAPPRYYAEREGLTAATDNVLDGLNVQFATLLRDMQDRGYFPVAMPRDCVDAETDWDDVSARVRRAIHVPFEWFGNPAKAVEWDEPVLYSLIEYFHDHAQRPRTEGYVHDFSGCGPHYAEHSAEAGGAVYRWRVNELLDRHKVGLNLGRFGDERGRLVHRFGSPLDDVADERAAEGADDPLDEVAHAIRDYRERGATVTQKRAALALMATAMEPRRPQMKVVMGADEDALFKIANNFGIRHRNNRQMTDYGDEFLDYLFGVFVSSVMLMEALEKRDAGGGAGQGGTAR